jgi:methionyl-tRNA synthetase
MSSEKSSFYITTAIDYVNGLPHIGHATEKVIADTMARYRRAMGEEVFFLTGTDENSLKNVQAAEAVGKETKVFVDENAEKFRNLGKTLDLSFDDFIRTTEGRHFNGAQKLWSMFRKEDVYKKKYRGLYCVGCEEFKLEKDLENGLCPEHNKAPEIVEEENWFFRLSSYGDILKEKITSGEMSILPDFRKNEVLSFIDGGLEDFSISRSVERAKHWGVPVPDDETQIMYVWVDALSNYITALDFATDGDRYEQFWNGSGERVHIIGKGILRFHTVYWPAMLLSAGLPIPTTIYAHEYLTVEGKKMSKSLGNVIAPEDLVSSFGVDGARYLLLSSLPYSKDGDLSHSRMVEKYNADLANGLGNLASRIITLANSLPQNDDGYAGVSSDKSLDIREEMRQFRLAEALERIWARVASANKYIEDEKPWELKKTNSEKFETIMRYLLGELQVIADAVAPFLPETSRRIIRMIETGQKDMLFSRREQ